MQIHHLLLTMLLAFNFNATTPDIDTHQAACLAQAVYYEAGSEDESGKLAVANVIKNRTEDKRFPGSICAVVAQKGQFNFYRHQRHIDTNNEGQMQQVRSSIEAALSVLSGSVNDNTNGAIAFVNLKIATDKRWLHGMRKTIKIQHHTFYAFK